MPEVVFEKPGSDEAQTVAGMEMRGMDTVEIGTFTLRTEMMKIHPQFVVRIDLPATIALVFMVVRLAHGISRHFTAHTMKC